MCHRGQERTSIFSSANLYVIIILGTFYEMTKNCFAVMAIRKGTVPLSSNNTEASTKIEHQILRLHI